MKFYEYKACSTCQKAAKFLEAEGVAFARIGIVEQPPSLAELRKMLGFLKADGGSIKSLFNTSGQLYRELKIADKLAAGMSEAEALELLSMHGKLIKRPFILTKTGGTVGFKVEVLKKLL